MACITLTIEFVPDLESEDPDSELEDLDLVLAGQDSGLEDQALVWGLAF